MVALVGPFNYQTVKCQCSNVSRIQMFGIQIPTVLVSEKNQLPPSSLDETIHECFQAKTKTKFAVGHRSIVDKSFAYGAKGARFQNPEKFICVIVYLYVL